MVDSEGQQPPGLTAVPGIDVSRPSIARTYDYLLGGSENYAVDRALGDKFINDLPGSRAIAYDSRGALIRAVERLTAAGIDQFLDLGSGLPTADNVHQVAQRQLPGARIVYVDNDPIALAHGRALLTENDATTVVEGDVREPESIDKAVEATGLLDLARPVAVMFSAVLHHVNDDEDPAGLVRYWVDRLPAGSHVYVSHFWSQDDERSAQMQQLLQGSLGRGRWRTTDEILGLLGDLEVVPPGLVAAAEWNPDGDPGELTDWQRLIAAVLGRKN